MKTKIIRVVFIVILLFCLIFGFTFCIYKKNHPKESLGVQAVNYLYSFSDVYDLAENDSKLKKICDEDAYSQLTPTDQKRALSVYLKFKGLPTEVIILRNLETSEGGYVLYTIKTDSLSEGRLFLFIYSLDNGKITNPREMEGIDFLRNDKDIIDYTIHDFEESGETSK